MLLPELPLLGLPMWGLPLQAQLRLRELQLALPALARRALPLAPAQRVLPLALARPGQQPLAQRGQEQEQQALLQPAQPPV